MSIRLRDTRGRSLAVNAWNWGVLHFAVECSRPPLFPDEGFRELLRSGGTELSAEQADELRQYLEEVVLPLLAPGQRLLHDLSVTDEPDDGAFHRDRLEKNYSLHHDVLVAVIQFLRETGGPIAVE